MSHPSPEDHGPVGDDEPLVCEPDTPDNLLILALIFASVGTVVAMTFIGVRIFDSGVRDEIRAKVLSVESPTLAAARATDESRLSRYQWVSQKDGIVRIPATHARDLVIADYRTVVPRPAPGTVVPTPAPAPMPSASVVAPAASASSR
ncbi:MAG: hypothetical protein ACHREM_06880 [Polyangiales bacterium]